MQYRKDKYGKELSALGYGCMRFTTKAGRIDIDKAEKEIMAAIEAGVNYFDTAYVYPGSEAALGEILSRNNVRDRVCIATKLPQYLVKSRGAIDRYFDEELARLKTDHVDYYLMHMMTDASQWTKLEALGIREWIAAKKESGQIRNIGFSYHGNSEQFCRIIDAYDWDFAQIQYNYMDEHTQAGRTGLYHASSKGIPIVIMEPLRGGRLVDLLPAKAKKRIAENERGWTAAEWAFRWLFDQPEVTVVLSGMNSLAMVEENCRIASDMQPGSLTEKDRKLIEEVRQDIAGTMKVGCTGCRYCMPCPKGVDIPALFRCYNELYAEGKMAGWQDYFQTVSMRREPAFASQCVKCGKCENHCPQALPIRELLPVADRAVRPLPVRAAFTVARAFVLGRGKKGDKNE